MSSATKSGISLCMIVRDEEHCIEQVLSASRPHVDQIVVVDTGSSDKTVDIAAQYADNIEHFEWIDDFSAARNVSLRLANQPWILVLDADEVVAPADFEQLRALTASEDVDGYLLTQRLYQNHNDGDRPGWTPVGDATPFSRGYSGYHDNKILRLFRNDPCIRYANKIHEIVDESIDPRRVEIADLLIHHYHEKSADESERHVRRNLAIQEALITTGTATAREYLSAGLGHLYVTKDYDTALQYLSVALEMGGNPGSAMEALAETFYRVGRLKDAWSLYEKLYAQNLGSSAVLNNLSNLRARSGNLKGAIALLDELLAAGIEDPVRRERIANNVEALRQALSDEEQAD